MSKNITVLGAGLVGGVMARELSKTYRVTSIDANASNLEPLKKSGIKTIQADLSDPESIHHCTSDADLVVGALPGFLGFKALETIIKSGKNVVDISFFPENSLLLDELAKRHGITAVVDCGVAPGISNLVHGYHFKRMEVDRFFCCVGGLPLKREWPFEYKAVFSPIDVIEEYTRPARVVENSKDVVKDPLSEFFPISFPQTGVLESFDSDGLRSLIHTMRVPNMVERTLRFPGTMKYLKAMREIGLFSYDEVEVKGKKIRPIDLTAKLLFPHWKMKEGEGDFTIMRIEIEGKENGKPIKYTYDLYDEYDAVEGVLSMARTTGYTCTGAVELVLSGKFSKKGVFPPEFVGEDEACTNFIFDYLKKRNVIYRKTVG